MWLPSGIRTSGVTSVTGRRLMIHAGGDQHGASPDDPPAEDRPVTSGRNGLLSRSSSTPVS